jgi:hypothetical protein
MMILIRKSTILKKQEYSTSHIILNIPLGREGISWKAPVGANHHVTVRVCEVR